STSPLSSYSLLRRLLIFPPRPYTTLFRSYQSFSATSRCSQAWAAACDGYVVPHSWQVHVSCRVRWSVTSHLAVVFRLGVTDILARGLVVHHSRVDGGRSEEHTPELQSRLELVCRLL